MLSDSSAKCFIHSFMQADGWCSVCGRSFCQSCLAAVDGLVKCQECRKRKVTPAQSPQTSAPGSLRSVGRSVDGKMLVSFLILVASAVLSFLLLEDQLSQYDIPTRTSFLAWCAYIPWCLFWGVPVLWGVTFRALRSSWMVLLYLNVLSIPFFIIGFLIFLFVASVYSVFGGGIFHFARHWWAVRRAEVPA